MIQNAVRGTHAGTGPAFGPLFAPDVAYPIDACALIGAFPKTLPHAEWLEAWEDARRSYSASYLTTLGTALHEWWGYCWHHGLDPLACDEIDVMRFLRIIRPGRSFEYVWSRAKIITLLAWWNGHYGFCRSPNLRLILRRAKRERPKAKKKAPFLAESIRAACDYSSRTFAPRRAKRDRAILLLLATSAMRGMESHELKRTSITFEHDGMRIDIVRSKTDPEAHGQPIWVQRTGSRYCPVGALEEWLAEHAYPHVFQRLERNGNVTRGRGLSRIGFRKLVKHYAEALGFNPDDFGTHSTRAGFVTDGLDLGADEADLQRVTRHRRRESLHGYDRHPPRTNFASRLGY